MWRYSDVERALKSQLTVENSPLLERVRENNRLILHNYEVEVEKNLECGLEGCCHQFAIQLIPNQILYPKFCDQHRTEHRRRQFLLSKPVHFS